VVLLGATHAIIERVEFWKLTRNYSETNHKLILVLVIIIRYLSIHECDIDNRLAGHYTET